MAKRKGAMLEQLDGLIKVRLAAQAAGGAGDGTVDVSEAAEAEISRDLLDPRVYEATTAWNDCSRVLKNGEDLDRLGVGLPTTAQLVDKVWGPDRLNLDVDLPFPPEAHAPQGFHLKWVIYD
eukprot:9998632-Heterocapsa_arctica.AAC.1